MLLLLSALALAGPLPDAATPFANDAVVVTLPSGMRVVLEEQHRTDNVALHLYVGVGSRDEGDGEHGAAHLFEHLMFEGSAHVPGNAYDSLLTAAGGENNAYTTVDETVYHSVFPAGALELALFLESDRLGFLVEGLTDEGLANQIDVVSRERAQGYAAPHGRDYDALYQLVYPAGHPYHIATIGTIADVEGFTTAGVSAFHERHYRLDNVILGLVGHFDADAVADRVRHWFSDVPKRIAVPRVEGPVAPRVEPVHGYLEDNVDDVTVHLAWRGVPVGHDDEAALAVASFVLSDGRGTRLDELYFGRRDITDTNVRSWSGDIDGMFVASVSGDGKSPEWLARRVQRVVDGLVRKPPTADEVDRAKKRIRGLLLDQLDRPQDRVESMVDCVRWHGEPGCNLSEWERVRAVTGDDVVDAVQRLLEHPGVTLSVVPFGWRELPEGARPVELP